MTLAFPRRSLALLAAAAVLGACSTLTVNSDWNTTIDFTQYKTWNFKNDTLPYSTFTQERIRQEIATTLASKGLTRDTLNPQLIVIYRVNLSSQTQYQTVSTGGYGYGPAWGGWGYGGVGYSTTTQTQIPIGALTIAIVDPKLNQLVWRGEADSQLSDNQSNAQLVQQAIQQMFQQFPPKKGEMPSNSNF
ncbi:MAG TPA: DUF4136 domain-containing protein [Gemmatimonadaceae bacterium]|nr:DUF4136 domain-containing protein [Gemmatimonadaceae bacterium]